MKGLPLALMAAAALALSVLGAACDQPETTQSNTSDDAGRSGEDTRVDDIDSGSARDGSRDGGLGTDGAARDAGNDAGDAIVANDAAVDGATNSDAGADASTSADGGADASRMDGDQGDSSTTSDSSVADSQMIVPLQDISDDPIPVDHEQLVSPRCRWAAGSGRPEAIVRASGEVVIALGDFAVCGDDSLVVHEDVLQDDLYDLDETSSGLLVYRHSAVQGALLPDYTNGLSEISLDRFGDRHQVSYLRAAGGDADFAYSLGSARQLPGEAPSLAEFPLVVRYDAEGAAVWRKRLEEFDVFAEWQDMSEDPEDAGYDMLGLDSDADGNVYILLSFHEADRQYDGPMVIKVGPDGESLWLRRYDGFPDFGYFWSPAEFRVAPDGTGAYLLESEERGLLHLAFDDSGNSWRRALQYEHEVVIDDVEGVIWRSHDVSWGLSTGALLARSDGTGCVSKIYKNTYENGSTPRLEHDNVLVSCFAASGEHLATEQYRPPRADPFTDVSSLLYDGALGETNVGGLVLVATGYTSAEDERAFFVFDLGESP